jgi:NADH-quinone oxidoreductase subunit N
MSGFIAPVLNYSILAPILIVLAGALLGVLVEAFAARAKKLQMQLVDQLHSMELVS